MSPVRVRVSPSGNRLLAGGFRVFTVSARDPSTGQISDILDALGIAEQVSSEQREVLGVARHATISRLRLMLGALAKDWRQYSPYFLAFKHGALAANREDLAWVDDDVDAVDETTPTREPSIAIWRRGRSELEAFGDFNLLPAEIVDQASRAGRLCRSLVDAFAESRVRIFDALELDENGEVVAFIRRMCPGRIGSAPRT